MYSNTIELALTEESQGSYIGFNEMLTAGSVKKVMAEIEAKSRDAYQVPITCVRLLPNFNVRVHDAAYEAHIEQLTHSILKNGYYQDKPLAGYVAEVDGQKVIYLTDGYSRFAAVGRANERGASILTLPMAFKPASTSMEDLTVDIWAANEGKPLTPYEKSVICKRLTGYGWDEEQIAERFGITKAYVNQLLMLIGSPIAIRRLVQEGKISADRAVYMLKKFGAKEAVEMLTNAEKQAEASGKTKIAAKHLPGAAYANAVKKQAPVMVDTLKGVKADPAYASLSPDIRSKLDELLAKLDEANGPADNAGAEAPESE
jgi:ParB family chromosome partitioning protein